MKKLTKVQIVAVAIMENIVRNKGDFNKYQPFKANDKRRKEYGL